MTYIYWLNPATGNSAVSDAIDYFTTAQKVTAPGYYWSVESSEGGTWAIWGTPPTPIDESLIGPLHFIYHGRTWAATR